MMMFINPLKYWWNRIIHKQFHIGWAVGVLIVGMIICIVILNKLI